MNEDFASLSASFSDTVRDAADRIHLSILYDRVAAYGYALGRIDEGPRPRQARRIEFAVMFAAEYADLSKKARLGLTTLALPAELWPDFVERNTPQRYPVKDSPQA